MNRKLLTFLVVMSIATWAFAIPYTVELYSGSYGSEVSFQIEDSEGTVVHSETGPFSNGTDYTFNYDDPAGTYTFRGMDSYGDGWNGGTADVVVNPPSVGFTGWTFGDPPGNEATTTFELISATEPVLSNGSVTPDGGTEYHTYLFSVTYMHPENIAPTDAWVNINNTHYPMTAEGTPDYSVGAEFTYSTMLPVGTNEYYFEFVYAARPTLLLPDTAPGTQYTVDVTATSLLTPPFTETFDTFPPTDWTLAGSRSWAQYDNGGDYCARANFWSWSSGNAELITAPIDLGTGTDYRIAFDWSSNISTSYDDQLDVDVSTDGLTWTNVWSKSGTELDSEDGAGNTAPGTFATALVDISAYSNIIWIRFNGISDYGPDVFVDNVTVEEIPSNPIYDCSPVTADLGTWYVGQTSPITTFTVTNLGGGTLNIENVEIVGRDAGHFSFTATPEVPAGLGNLATMDIDVTYAPTAAGTHSDATLNVTDDLTRVVHSYPLTGTALDPETVPWSENFDSATPAQGWIVNNLNLDDYTWELYGYTSYSSPNSIRIDGQWTATNYDDWAFSCPITLEAGVSYDFEWWSRDYSTSYTPHNISVWVMSDADPAATVYELENYTQGSTTWLEHTISYTPATRGTYYMGFYSGTEGAQYYHYIDDVGILETPTGPVFQITPDTYAWGDVSIYEQVSTTFMIENIGLGTLTINDGDITITGDAEGNFSIGDGITYPIELLTDETYPFFLNFHPVTAGEKSAILQVVDNIGRATHTIPLTGRGYEPTIHDVPYSQNFDSWTPGITVADDWEQDTLDGLDWTIQTGSTTSGSTGPSDDMTGGGNYLYTESSGFNDMTAYIMTPYLNLDTVTAARLNFWYHMYGATMGTLSVEIQSYGSRTWLEIWSMSGDQGDQWLNAIVSLASYSGTVRLRFKGLTGSSYTSDMAFDDVTIEALPEDPIYNCTPDSAAFGEVNVGTAPTQTFTVSNTGAGTLGISDVRITGPQAEDFSYSASATIPASVTDTPLTIDVTFEPTTIGEKSATLEITDDQGRAVHTYPLTGTAVNYNYGGGNLQQGGYWFANSTTGSSDAESQPTYDWITEQTNSLSSGDWNSSGSGDDSAFGPIDLGFEFDFFGNTYSEVYIGSNGYLTFGSAVTTYASSMSIPNSGTPNNVLAAAAMDINMSTNTYADCMVYYGGNANRFVVTYWNAHDYGQANNWLTFQIIIYSNGTVIYQYNQDESQNWDASGSFADDACIGIENADGSLGVQYRNNGVGGPLFGSDLAVAFSTNAANLDHMDYSTPYSAEVPTPADNATGISIYPRLEWEYSGEINPDGYLLDLSIAEGASILTGYDVGDQMFYNVSSALAAGTMYSWTITPYTIDDTTREKIPVVRSISARGNSRGNAIDCPVWDFTTVAGEEATSGTNGSDPVGFDFDGGSGSGGSSVQIIPPAGTSGNITVTQFDVPPSTLPYSENALDLFFAIDDSGLTPGAGTFTVTFEWDAPAPLGTTPEIAWWSVAEERWIGNLTDPDVTILDSRLDSAPYYITFETTHFSDWAIGNGQDTTLPVELSSFTAAVTQNNTVMLTWIAQSETGALGYHLHRNEENALNSAIRITGSIIQAQNTSEEVVYTWEDTDLFMDNTYYYWIESIDIDGTVDFFGPVFVTLSDDDDDDDTPEYFDTTALYGNYPNPFNPVTDIHFSLRGTAGQPVHTSLVIYNVRGQMVRTLIDGLREPGMNQSVVWDGKDDSGNNLSSGVYFYRLQTDDYSQMRKAMLLK